MKTMANPQAQERSAKTTRATAKPALPGASDAQATPTPAAPSDAQVATYADLRRARIATAAYHRAAQRGFVGASAEQDWLEAEAEFDDVEIRALLTDRGRA